MFQCLPETTGRRVQGFKGSRGQVFIFQWFDKRFNIFLISAISSFVPSNSPSSIKPNPLPIEFEFPVFIYSKTAKNRDLIKKSMLEGVKIVKLSEGRITKKPGRRAEVGGQRSDVRCPISDARHMIHDAGLIGWTKADNSKVLNPGSWILYPVSRITGKLANL